MHVESDSDEAESHKTKEMEGNKRDKEGLPDPNSGNIISISKVIQSTA